MATATKTKEASQSLETVDPRTGEIVVADDYSGYAEDSGAGFENTTQSDLSIPFLSVLQAGSPEVLAEDSSAKPGMIVNRTTGELIPGKEGLTFVPALVEHSYVEWVPRDKGGGLVGSHAIDSEIVRRVRETQPLGAYKHPDNENDLIETYALWVVALTAAGDPYPAVINFSSTAIRPFKDFLFRARSIVIGLPDGRKITNLPLFSHCWVMRTARQEKAGNVWHTPLISFAGENATASRLAPSSDLYQKAKSVREAVSAGTVKAATETLTRAASDGSLGSKASADAEKAPY